MVELSSKPFRRPEGMTTWLQQLKENVFDKSLDPRAQRALGGDAKLFEVREFVSITSFKAARFSQHYRWSRRK